MTDALDYVSSFVLRGNWRARKMVRIGPAARRDGTRAQPFWVVALMDGIGTWHIIVK
jgi:hypothetical protein